MLKWFGYFALLAFYIAGLVYLFLPNPKVVQPESVFRSDEPGDTWQNPNQSAYYTDLTRSQVMSFHQDSFALEFGPFVLPSYRLNYRPEDTATYIRPQIYAYYLEEVVHPLRESLFIGGWNPKLSPQTQYLYPFQRDRWAMVRAGKEWDSKITLRPYYYPLVVRLLIWTAIFPLSYLVLNQFRLSLAQLYNAITS